MGGLKKKPYSKDGTTWLHERDQLNSSSLEKVTPYQINPRCPKEKALKLLGKRVDIKPWRPLNPF